MGKRRLIYVGDDSEWERVRAAADQKGMSVSGYLIDCHRRVLGLAGMVSHPVSSDTVPSVTTSTDGEHYVAVTTHEFEEDPDIESTPTKTAVIAETREKIAVITGNAVFNPIDKKTQASGKRLRG